MKTNQRGTDIGEDVTENVAMGRDNLAARWDREEKKTTEEETTSF